MQEQGRRQERHAEPLSGETGGQHAARLVAVGEGRHDRGEHDAWQELRERQQAAGAGPALRVGVHEHRDPFAVLGGVEAREADADSAQRGVPAKLGERLEPARHRPSLLSGIARTGRGK